MSRYPARIEHDETGYAISFRDIPEALAGGENLEDAKAEAAGALRTAMEFYFEDRRPVPAPSAAREGEIFISLPVSVDAKVMLLNTMLAQNVTAAELARRMGVRPQEVNRIIDLHHATKIDTLAEALAALGVELALQAGVAGVPVDAIQRAIKAAEAARAAIAAMTQAQDALAEVVSQAPTAPERGSASRARRRRVSGMAA